MHKNHLYNLMSQLVTEQRSLWRIQHEYVKESGNAEEQAFWEKMIKDKEAHIQELTDLLKATL